MDSEELRAALAEFRHSSKHYRHWSRTFYYSEGVAFLAEKAGAQWLLDHIAAYQKRARKDRRLRDVQVWTLRVTGPHGARVTCSRGDGSEAFYEDVPLLSAFPLREVSLRLEAETLTLPDER